MSISLSMRHLPLVVIFGSGHQSKLRLVSRRMMFLWFQYVTSMQMYIMQKAFAEMRPRLAYVVINEGNVLLFKDREVSPLVVVW
mgnify:CR=1 FL=1